MKRILATLLPAIIFIACKSKKDEGQKNIPSDLTKYFSFFHDNSKWYYKDSISSTADTFTIHKAATGAYPDKNEQYYTAMGTGLIYGRDINYEVGINYVKIHSTMQPIQTYLELAYNENKFAITNFWTVVRIIPEMTMDGHSYKDVLYYYAVSNQYFTEMWFAPYIGLIKYKNYNDTYILKAYDIK